MGKFPLSDSIHIVPKNPHHNKKNTYVMKGSQLLNTKNLSKVFPERRNIVKEAWLQYEKINNVLQRAAQNVSMSAAHPKKRRGGRAHYEEAAMQAAYDAECTNVWECSLNYRLLDAQVS